MLSYKNILITGGAGFVGSNLAILLKRDHPHSTITALDNLYRRGSELALKRFKAAGVKFIHGDIRCPEDLLRLEPFDLMIECSAEPSVQAGYSNDPTFLIHTNLLGTIHCLEAVKRFQADLVFLSTSRVYSIHKLQRLPLIIEGKRVALKDPADSIGWTKHGIETSFSLEAPRSLYGSTKLASELILQEYAHMYGLNILINRCGVIAGPWQMGKVDQGFVSLWIARHLFGGVLKYMGYGGKGYQVRDILHIEDLYRLLYMQLNHTAKHKGKTYNAGGGLENSTSLAELTDWCTDRTGKGLNIESDCSSHPADIPYYVTDNSEVTASTGWVPEKTLPETFTDIANWLETFRSELEPIFN